MCPRSVIALMLEALPKKRPFIILVCVLCAQIFAGGCDTFPSDDADGQDTVGIEPDTATWKALGPDRMRAIPLRIFEPYLYASAGLHGLIRKNIRLRGSGWEFLGLDSTVSEGRYVSISDVVVHPNHDDWLLAAYNSNLANDPVLFRSFDDGQTWERVDSYFSYTSGDRTYYLEIVNLFADSERIAVNAVHETNNFGDSWHEIKQGQGFPKADVIVRHPTNPSIIWIGGEDIVLEPTLSYSTNSGRTWTWEGPTYSLRQIASQTRVGAIALVPGKDEVVYVIADDKLLKSMDRGQSWKALNPDVSWGGFAKILTNPQDGSQLWITVSSPSGLIKPQFAETRDGGITWHSIDTPIDKNILFGGLVLDSEEKVLYVGSDRGILRHKIDLPSDDAMTE